MQSHHRRRSSKSIFLPRISTTVNTSNNTITNSNGQPNYARRMTIHLPETIPDKTYLYGYALLAATIFMFVASFYTIIVSKYIPDSNLKVTELYLLSKGPFILMYFFQILNRIKYDDYYCFLIPTTGLVWIYWVMWNWMGMKFFRHN